MTLQQIGQRVSPSLAQVYTPYTTEGVIYLITERVDESLYERINGTLYTTVHSRTLCVIKIGVLKVNLIHYLKYT